MPGTEYYGHLSAVLVNEEVEEAGEVCELASEAFGVLHHLSYDGGVGERPAVVVVYRVAEMPAEGVDASVSVEFYRVLAYQSEGNSVKVEGVAVLDAAEVPAEHRF